MTSRTIDRHCHKCHSYMFSEDPDAKSPACILCESCYRREAARHRKVAGSHVWTNDRRLVPVDEMKAQLPRWDDRHMPIVSESVRRKGDSGIVPDAPAHWEPARELRLWHWEQARKAQWTIMHSINADVQQAQRDLAAMHTNATMVLASAMQQLGLKAPVATEDYEHMQRLRHGEPVAPADWPFSDYRAGTEPRRYSDRKQWVHADGSVQPSSMKARLCAECGRGPAEDHAPGCSRPVAHPTDLHGPHGTVLYPAKASRGEAVWPENEVHKAIKPLLGKRDQGRVMGALRAVLPMFNPRSAPSDDAILKAVTAANRCILAGEGSKAAAAAARKVLGYPPADK